MMTTETILNTLEKEVNAAKFCWYKTGGPIDFLAQPKTIDELTKIVEAAKAQQLKITVLGVGSNTIIATQGIRGISLICRGLTEIKRLDANRFYLGAGLAMAKVAKTMQEANLTGAEFMIGIPGTLGGAVALNAGAMGQETAEMIESVDVFLINKLVVKTWPLEKMCFA